VVYANSLQSAIQLVRGYFAQNSQLTTVMLNDLEKLSKINIHPETLEITGSLSAFSVLKQ